MVSGSQLVCSLPENSANRAAFIQSQVIAKYNRMLHPPLTYLGDAFQYRKSDGIFNVSHIALETTTLALGFWTNRLQCFRAFCRPIWVKLGLHTRRPYHRRRTFLERNQILVISLIVEYDCAKHTIWYSNTSLGLMARKPDEPVYLSEYVEVTSVLRDPSENLVNVACTDRAWFLSKVAETLVPGQTRTPGNGSKSRLPH